MQDMEPPWKRISHSLFGLEEWISEADLRWLFEDFLPFYEALSHDQQRQYCDKWGFPQTWISLFLHPDLEDAFYQADLEDFGSAPPPINYREILLRKWRGLK